VEEMKRFSNVMFDVFADNILGVGLDLSRIFQFATRQGKATYDKPQIQHLQTLSSLSYQQPWKTESPEPSLVAMFPLVSQPLMA
jgi:hypothetical protein